MATRRERVILDLEDNFTSGVARAAAAAGLLEGALNDLDGSGRKSAKGIDESSKSTDRFGQSSRKAGPDIDRYSGRLRTLADAALTLGPALIPIGASAIPALTAALAGLGSAAGAIGVTVLAFHGLGDGLKAIDAYQLEPTAENLSKLRIEMEKLGPAGAEFAHFLDGLEEPMSNLQKIARAGLFPGVELGIDHLMNRLPQVRRIVFDLAQGMGELADEAGRNLAGSKFDAFFNYIESDARPTLEAFAHAAGNVAEGVANLLVSFAPLTRDFTHSLEGASEAFAKWSRGLDTNTSFQHFLEYVRESGPQVSALLGAMAQAIGGLVHAAAPFGRIMLPALTGIAKAFAAIANSPIGGPLYTAAAALTLFNRGAQLTTAAAGRLGSAFDTLGTKAETTRGKLALIGARGGVVLGATVAVGALADQINRIHTEDLQRSLTALTFGDVTSTIEKVVDSLHEINSPKNKVDLGKILSLDDTLFTSSMSKFRDNVDQVDQSLANMVESGQKAEAANIFQKITDLASAKGVDPAQTAKAFDAYAQALSNVSHSAERATGSTNPFQAGLRAVVGELRDAKNAASDLSGALDELNGWFDKRQAVRDYRDSVKELSKALKNGFQPKDAATLDQVGRNILQVAQNIKDKSLRSDFLAKARAGLEEMANKSGPKAEAALKRLIAQFDAHELTHPPTPKVDVDNKAANSKVNDTTVRLHKYGNIVAIAKANVDNSDAIAGINQARTFLDRLNGQTATQYINVVTRRYNLPQPKADGGLITGPGGPRDDVIPALLSNREYVVKASAVAKYGVAMMDSINAERFADGGSVGKGPRGTFTLGDVVAGQVNPFGVFVQGAFDAAKALKALKKAVEDSQKSVDKARAAHDAAVANRDNLSSTIQQGLMGDGLFADVPGTTGSVWAAGGMASHAATPADAIAAANARKDRANRLIAAINTLKSKGVNGPALLEILNEGLEAAEAMAAADIGTLSTFSTAVNQSNAALAAAGLAGGNAVYGDDVKATQKALNLAVKELHEIKAAIKHLEAEEKKNHEKNAKDVKDGVNGAASNGHRRGHR